MQTQADILGKSPDFLRRLFRRPVPAPGDASRYAPPALDRSHGRPRSLSSRPAGAHEGDTAVPPAPGQPPLRGRVALGAAARGTPARGERAGVAWRGRAGGLPRAVPAPPPAALALPCRIVPLQPAEERGRIAAALPSPRGRGGRAARPGSRRAGKCGSSPGGLTAVDGGPRTAVPALPRAPLLPRRDTALLFAFPPFRCLRGRGGTRYLRQSTKNCL